MKDIKELLINGYDFNMGKYLSDGWEYYKKGVGNYIGFTIVFFVIVFIVAVIPFANILVSIVEYTLVAGLYIFTANLLQNKEDFPHFFHGFNSFGQIFLFSLVLMAFMIPAFIIIFIYIIPFDLVIDLIKGEYMYDDYFFEDYLYFLRENLVTIVLLYAFILLYIAYLYISYSFTLIFIVERKMNFWDAMETSRKIVAKNFFSFMVMYILMFIMIAIGVTITCGLGILVGFTYSYLVVYAAYNNIVGTVEDQPEIVIETE